MMNQSTFATAVLVSSLASTAPSCLDVDEEATFDATTSGSSTAAPAEPETPQIGSTSAAHSSPPSDEFSADEDPAAGYYLCIDACDPSLSCWVPCMQSGKVTNCLQSGFTCNASAVCGNKKCEKYETCKNCPSDCVAAQVSYKEETSCKQYGAFKPAGEPTPTWLVDTCWALYSGYWDGLCQNYKVTTKTDCGVVSVSKTPVGGTFIAQNTFKGSEYLYTLPLAYEYCY